MPLHPLSSPAFQIVGQIMMIWPRCPVQSDDSSWRNFDPVRSKIMLAHEAQTTRESILVQIALLTQCIAKNVTHKVFFFFTEILHSSNLIMLMVSQILKPLILWAMLKSTSHPVFPWMTSIPSAQQRDKQGSVNLTSSDTGVGITEKARRIFKDACAWGGKPWYVLRV